MPLFFFDTDDGYTHVRDDAGCELPDPQASRRMALEAITSIAGEHLPSGEWRLCTVEVRDAADRTIYRAKVELTGEWLD